MCFRVPKDEDELPERIAIEGKTMKTVKQDGGVSPALPNTIQKLMEVHILV